MSPRLAAAAALAVLAALAAGCGATVDTTGSVPRSGHLAAVRTPQCSAGSTRSLRSGRVAYAAVVRDQARVYRMPGRRAFHRFGRLNVNGVPTVFAAVAAVVDGSCRATWYHVQLPLRPNGASGYVRARDVLVARVRTRILVDLSARRLTLFRGGRPALVTPVAVGSPATPTPTGRFYVNQRLLASDPGGPYGPGALGISAFSPVLTHWAQGGPIGIHGTNEPWSIGRPVSNGCIRVPNPTLRRLFAATLAGTPVQIRA